MQRQNNQNELRQSSLLEGFHFRSFSHTLMILNCSKFYLNKLRNSGIIDSYYFEFKKDGSPTGKPYFKIEDINNTLVKVSSKSKKDKS